MDVSTPASPAIVKTIPTTSSPERMVISSDEKYMYIADAFMGLIIVDLKCQL